MLEAGTLCRRRVRAGGICWAAKASLSAPRGPRVGLCRPRWDRMGRRDRLQNPARTAPLARSTASLAQFDADIAYAEITDHGMVRHPEFKAAPLPWRST